MLMGRPGKNPEIKKRHWSLRPLLSFHATDIFFQDADLVLWVLLREDGYDNYRDSRPNILDHHADLDPRPERQIGDDCGPGPRRRQDRFRHICLHGDLHSDLAFGWCLQDNPFYDVAMDSTVADSGSAVANYHHLRGHHILREQQSDEWRPFARFRRHRPRDLHDHVASCVQPLPGAEARQNQQQYRPVWKAAQVSTS